MAQARRRSPRIHRVAPGYVELTVFRRQKGKDAERDDLALARWFGGEDLPPAADEIWQKLRLGEKSPNARIPPVG